MDMTRVTAKLSDIMFKRFGVEVEYLPIGLSDSASPVLKTVQRNAGAPMIVTYNQLIVPIRIEGALVGAASVRDTNHLTPKELMQVKDTIDLIFVDLAITEELTQSFYENVISLDSVRQAAAAT